MFGPLGAPELIIIFVIALIVLGPRKLPELGKSLGKSLAEFKRASSELRNSLEEEIRVEDERERPKVTPTPVVAAAASEATPVSGPVADESDLTVPSSGDSWVDESYDRAQDENRPAVAETTPRGANL